MSHYSNPSPKSLLQVQFNLLPLLVIVNEDLEWEVEEILDFTIVRRQLKCRVYWIGYDHPT